MQFELLMVQQAALDCWENCIYFFM